MMRVRRSLAIIPARGGSKGVPRKNIRLLGDKPLLAWTIAAAQDSGLFARIIVSSDDMEILAVAEQYGSTIPLLRPAHLAQDDSSTIDVLLHVLEALPDYDQIVLLQPTSPFRTAQHLCASMEMLQHSTSRSCVSLTLANKSPYWMYSRAESGQVRAFVQETPRYTRRQDLPDVYALNGAIYIADVAQLKATRSLIQDDTLGYVMSERDALDIDTELDFQFAQWLLTREENSTR